MRFQFLKEHHKEYNIQKACKILRISRSGYYDYLHRRKSKRVIENEALAEMIADIFHENQGRYGARRIQQVLKQRNVPVNEAYSSLGFGPCKELGYAEICRHESEKAGKLESGWLIYSCY